MLDLYRLGMRLGSEGRIAGDHRSHLTARASALVRSDDWTGVLLAAAGRLPLPPKSGKEPLPPVNRTPDLRVRPETSALVDLLSPPGEEPDLPARVAEVLVEMEAELRGLGAAATTEYLEAESLEAGMDIPRAFGVVVDHLASHGIALYDVGDDPRLKQDLRLYRDATHLNEGGAAHFSRLLQARCSETVPPP